MKTYIIHSDQRARKMGRDEAKSFYQTQFFGPLAVLASESSGQIAVKTTMSFLGMAVVEATDAGKTSLKKAGYKLMINSSVKIIW